MRAGILLNCVVSTVIAAGIAAPATAAPTDEQIKNAIERGAKNLQERYKYLGNQAKGGNSDGGTGGIGQMALTGLALIEAGITEDDPALKYIVEKVRAGALSQLAVYEVSLCIMFLDRLGHGSDSLAIQILALRLANTIGPTGGWAYDCTFGILSDDEIARLRKISAPSEGRLEGGRKGKSGAGKGSNTEPKKDALAPERPVVQGLYPDVKNWLEGALQRVNQQPFPEGGDNSNTQFAMIALWCSRKHGAFEAANAALKKVAKRFSDSPNADGGWGYNCPMKGGVGMGGNFTTTPQMTCAGLISQAIKHGLETKKGDPPPKLFDDRKIKNAFNCLANWVDGKGGQDGVNQATPRELTSDFYFLWSLERTMVIYQVEEVGKTNWYEWGAQALINTQGAGGGWSMNTQHVKSDEVNTAFAVLFLCRANLVKDLSGRLKGESTLRGKSGLPFAPKVPPSGNNSAKPPVANMPPSNPNTKPEPNRGSTTPPPPAANDDSEAEIAKLCDSLISAKPDARPAIIAKYRDSKGGMYTDALARAAGRLAGESQQQAREALAKRLTRMKGSTLQEMLKDPESEIRLGAATACGLKADKQLAPYLIESLSDLDANVVKAARSSLASLSGKDYGPEPNASATDKEKAIRAWQAWWKVQVK